MPRFNDGEIGSSVRGKINAAIDHADSYYDDVTAALAASDTFADDTIIAARTEGAAYQAVSAATATSIANAGGQDFEVLQGANGYDVRAFGASFGVGNVTANTTAFKAWAAAIDASGFKRGVIPATESGNYYIEETIGFASSNVLIEAWGASVISTITDGSPMFDLNDGALADETSIESSVYWKGGRFSHNDTPLATLEVSSVSGTFYEGDGKGGEFLSFGTSGATARIVSISGTTLTICVASGTPQAGETVTGDTDGATATVDSYTAGNNATCFRARGITRGGIEGVFGQDFGTAFIDCAIRDGFYFRDIHGFKNGRHYYTPDFLTTSVGNPQAVSLTNFGLSTHYIAAVDIQGSANAFALRDGYTIGPHAVRAVSRADGVNGQEVLISGVTFEQGDDKEPYIVMVDGGSSTFRNMSVTECGFGAGGAGAALIADISRVSGFTFAENFISNAGTAGWLTFDANCENISIGRNEYGTAPGAISFAMDRDQISMWPYVLTLSEDLGRINNRTDFTTAAADDEAAVDVSTLVFPAWIDELIAILPPKGYDVSVAAKDSDATTIGGNCWYQIVTDSSVSALNAGYRHASAIVTNYPDDAWSAAQGYVEADSNGDVWRQARSTNGGTVTGWGRITKIHW